MLVESDVEGTGNGIFAGVLVTGEENSEALLVSGWVRFAENPDDLGVGEPLWDLGARSEAFAEL